MSCVDEPTSIGDRLEPLWDYSLVEHLRGGARLHLHEPALAPRPAHPPVDWYSTVLKVGDSFRWYYQCAAPSSLDRAILDGWLDGDPRDRWGYVTSSDGKEWTTTPKVVVEERYFSHNMSPFTDSRPGVPKSERFKALAGAISTGLFAWVSPDGDEWRQLRDHAVIPVPAEPGHYFDSQNVAFWSEHEETYVCFFRHYPAGQRRIMRTISDDFVHWSDPEPVEANLPGEELYTSQAHPYYRAPHLYVALANRFFHERGDLTDIVLMTSRGGARFDRTFPQALIRPGTALEAWGNRANYAALNIVETGPDTMSLWVRGERYDVRVDGLASLRAEYDSGELLTRPLTFAGSTLVLNASTSGRGFVRAELQDRVGRPIVGFTLDDSEEIYGDGVEIPVLWKGGDLGSIAGKAVRLRLELREADVYAFRFR